MIFFFTILSPLFRFQGVAKAEECESVFTFSSPHTFHFFSLNFINFINSFYETTAYSITQKNTLLTPIKIFP
jgi:hypothetical protein